MLDLHHTRTKNDNITSADLPTGPEGSTQTELLRGHGPGAHFYTVPDHDTIATTLLDHFGPGYSATIVHDYTTLTGLYDIGAHAIAAANTTGTLTTDDPARPHDHHFPPTFLQETARILVTYLDPHGHPAQPPETTHTPTQPGKHTVGTNQQHPNGDPGNHTHPADPGIELFTDTARTHLASADPSAPGRRWWGEGSLFSPARPAVRPSGHGSDAGLEHVVQDIHDVFDRPRTLDQLYTSVLPLRPDLSFDDLRALREQSYLRNGIRPPTVSRESLDTFLRGIWDCRELMRNADDIYTAYSDRGAGEPAENPHEYFDALVQILTERAPGPARQASVWEASGRTTACSHRTMPTTGCPKTSHSCSTPE